MKRSGKMFGLALAGVMALPIAAAANDDPVARMVREIIIGQANMPSWDWEDRRFQRNWNWDRHDNDDDDDGRRRGVRGYHDDDDDDDGRRRGWRNDDDDDDDGRRRHRGHDDDD